MGLDPLELLPGKSSQESLAKGRKEEGGMGLLVEQMLVVVCSWDRKPGRDRERRLGQGHQH